MKSSVSIVLPVLALSAALSVFACATPGSGERKVPYSDERSILFQIEQTRKVMESDPVEALARIRALKDNTKGFAQLEALYEDAVSRSRSEFDAAVAGGHWSDAMVIFRSLDALSAAPTGWTADKISANRLRVWSDEGNRTLAELGAVQRSTPEDEAPAPGVAARLLKGTVTVWVDRGLRVENGVGYADRVIGSGFFIDERGYFITNYHVIESEVNPKYEGYSRLFIKLPSDPDTRVPAKVIGWDPVLDLALVKTEIEPPAVFQLGSSRDLKVGNRIYAIGSPAGLEQTLTSGIVSAQNRRLLSLGDVLQIDAPINHGNSGGPIIDEAGRVQAVVFAGIEPYEGLNFAIPVELLRIDLPALYEGGKVSHPWLGAYGKTVPLPGRPDLTGVSVVYTAPGSPCEIAGIPEGAVITAVNGTPVRTLEELQGYLIRENPRTIVRLTGTLPVGIAGREAACSGADTESSQTRDWFVMLVARPEQPGEGIAKTDLRSRALLPLTGLRLEQVGNSGRYTVASVVRGSIADESGFSEMDVVEIREFVTDSENGIASVQLYTKRRKSGYLDAFIGLGASLDSPSYF